MVAVIDVPGEALAAFGRYEDAVLPLLARHGGRLDRRLRSADGTTEVHVLSFAEESGYRDYLADPERGGHRSLLTGVETSQRVLEGLVDAP
ncbi:hypothetical protein DQ244_10280 [Blastococcus sp. TBT05-19]|uniref:hypothetical protein n=1 Tax=Blastococcus sp. TBT05-19 TaxID=2250581 RepID=UPI000DE99CA7|nr:hypothetical protein [Blastococcus sp. TBT05-19]RBY91679.1 hypothetical protein DQ244_10280 [Blastococcus sp. TBT05-19]